MKGAEAGAPLRLAAFSAVDLSLPHGHALHLRGLFDALTEGGCEVELVTPRPASAAPAVRFRKIQVPIIRYRVFGLWCFELAGGLSLLARCARRRPTVIYARQDLYTVAPAVVSSLLRIPLVSEVNAAVAEELAISGKHLASRVAAACERFTLRRADRIIVLDRVQGEELAGRLHVDPERIRVVPIAACLPSRVDAVDVRNGLGVDPRTFVVGFAGNLSRNQGVETLIDALRHVPSSEVHLWVIGGGEEEEKLRERARGLGPRVKFFGGMPREVTDSLLASCQLLVAPYRRPEYDRVSGGGALSSKVLTYLAADRPILLSDIPSYDWLEGMGAGRLFPAGDAMALALAIQECFASWCASGRPLSDWPWAWPGPGRRFVEEGRTWGDSASKVEEILRDLLSAAGPRRRSRAL